jgi:PAS domain S-box-containing protein
MQRKRKKKVSNWLWFLLESICEGILGVDTSGNVMFINPAGEKLVGYTADELIGRSAHQMIHYAHYGKPFSAVLLLFCNRIRKKPVSRIQARLS